MSHRDGQHRSRYGTGAAGPEPARRPSPGKVTLTSKLPGRSAAVQRKPVDATGSAAVASDVPAAKAVDENVTLTIEWSGKFGADLSARLRVRGRNSGKDKWATIVEDVEVGDANGTQGAASERLSRTLTVDRYVEYEVNFSPVTEKPDDRYRDTSATVRVDASASTATLSTRLDVNRWNRKNVEDVWTGRNIDPDKADDVVQAKLFGRTVSVHKTVVPRVEKTNALYEALDEATKQEIRDSLFVTGGYAVRTTSQGAYSNHSVGFAIDVNYHERTKQNHHFEEDDMALLTSVVEPVVRTDPAFASFQIRQDTGLRQLQAAHAFNQRFPAYLANLLDMADSARELDQYLYAEKNVGYYADYFRTMREQKAKELFDSIDGKMLSKAIKGQKDGKKKAQLQLIQANWQALRAWLFGVDVRDAQDKQQKRITGMIPLREDVLKMFLDTGWTWGGNWREEKDYMHFEDPKALEHVVFDKGKKP